MGQRVAKPRKETLHPSTRAYRVVLLFIQDPHQDSLLFGDIAKITGPQAYNNNAIYYYANRNVIYTPSQQP